MILSLLFSISLANPAAAPLDSAAVAPSAATIASHKANSSARTSQFDAAQRQLWQALSLWRLTQNAAGIAHDPLSLVARGESGFSFGKTHSDLRTSQQGTNQQLGAFYAEQQLPIASWLVAQGRFTYGLSRYDQRAWNDRSNATELSLLATSFSPYNKGEIVHGVSNSPTTVGINTTFSPQSPLNAGSEQLGRYDGQTVDTKFRLATRSSKAWNFGLGVKYAVNDLARLKDPRSRARSLHYRLAPAVVYAPRWGQIGATLWYERRKEKIDNVTSVQQDAQWNYYTLHGLEHLSGGAGSYQGFMRQWVEHAGGGEINIGREFRKAAILFSVRFQRSHEEAVGNNRYTPSEFEGQNLQISEFWKLRLGNWWLVDQNEVLWQRGYTNEHTQSLTLTTDPQTKIVSRHYETLLSLQKRFQNSRFAAFTHFRALHTTSPWEETSLTHQQLDGFYGWLLGYENFEQRYLLSASSRETQRLLITLEGGKLLTKGWWTSAEVGASFALRHQLHLSSSTSPLSPLWEAQQNIDARHIGRAALSARYDFPWQVRQQSVRLFARVTGEYATAFGTSLHGTSVSFTLGLLH